MREVEQLLSQQMPRAAPTVEEERIGSVLNQKVNTSGLEVPACLHGVLTSPGGLQGQCCLLPPPQLRPALRRASTAAKSLRRWPLSALGRPPPQCSLTNGTWAKMMSPCQCVRHCAWLCRAELDGLATDPVLPQLEDFTVLDEVMVKVRPPNGFSISLRPWRS